MKTFKLMNTREKLDFILNCSHKTPLEKITWMVDAVFRKIDYKVHTICFNKKFYDKERKVFNFKGVILPFGQDFFESIHSVFEDTFYIHCYMNDDYSRQNCEYLDSFALEGSYCYKDDDIDVCIKPDDIVVDAGSFIGDFAALAVYYGAKVYAFEPVTKTYEQLCKTADQCNGAIIPVKMGLSDKVEKDSISTADFNGGNTFMSMSMKKAEGSEEVDITTLDEFVKINNIEKIDFIKSDIEGYERKLLTGAKEVLRKFAPKLAICTYHLPDDPEVLEKIILDANPAYKVVQLRHKLYAAVPSKN